MPAVEEVVPDEGKGAAREDESAASEGGAPQTAREHRTGGLRRLLPWVVTALAIGAAVAFAVLWRSAESARTDAQALDHTRAQVVATGTQFLGALTNFKGQTIDADVRRIRSYAVGDFADQVSQFFGPSNVALLKRAQVSSLGRVRSVFVQSISGPQASVFGVVDETITKSSSAPQSETLRIDVEMVDTSTGWKVSSVAILQSPGGGPFGSG
ncbi:MAG: hypothetical protein ACJ77A_08700 [Actinomycetota bacterium]